ncbi:MAG TPA: YciI family protein [Polyangiaceae bacterium]|nr:YciI family protein [Polyangiaceae bacterium]
MRVIVLVKASPESEAGEMPKQELLAEMGSYNEELVKAGIMLGGEGLHPTSKAKRVRFTGKERAVIDGPFAETKELVAGYWLWQVKSMDEAVEWLKRAPFDGGAEVEIRPVFEAEDFGAEYTPELKARDERLREQVEERQKR